METNENREFEFDLDWPDVCRSLAYYVAGEDAKKQLKFDPAVFQSRYSLMSSILKKEEWKPHIKKVAEFGCADMKYLMLMRQINHITHILQIDIDDELLKRFEQRARPFAYHYLSKRKLPLTIDIYHGSVDSPDECLADTDVVLCVELIEHLYPETEQNVAHNFFGFIKPKIAVFSTPNADFNILFGGAKFDNGFRHEDHKFEWTKQQFKDWAHNICLRYPNYRFSLCGVGELPDDADETLGKCSQVAIFVRNDMFELLNDDKSDEIPSTLIDTDSEMVFPIEKFKYKLLYSIDYPHDTRNTEEKIMDDVHYFMHRHLDRETVFFNENKNVCEFPIEEIFEFVHEAADINELRTIIRTEFVINENDCIERDVPRDDDYESDYEADYDPNKENIEVPYYAPTEPPPDSWDD